MPLFHNHVDARVEAAWILRQPLLCLNLAPRPPFSTSGGLLRKLALLATALCLGSCSRNGADGDAIVIGLAGPFSQPRGVAMRRAAELAVREVNARGGVRGRPLALRVLDDSGRPAVAIRIAHELAHDPAVLAVIGHLTSGTSLAAGRVYGEDRRPVVMISPSASSPDLSGLNPYVFRVCPTDLSHGAQLARYARQELGTRRAGLIYIDDDYGRGLRLSFAAEFRRLGGEVVSEDPVLGTTASVEPYLARLRRRGGVDVLMLATERGGAEVALREMARLGISWPVLGGDALTGIEAAGPLAEGVRLSSAYLADRPGERNAVFVAAYARAYEHQRPDHRGAASYDIVHLLARLLEDAGVDRVALRDRLARVGRDLPAYEGVTGTIAFDGRGDVPAKPVVIGVVQGGRIVTVGSP
ncbi:MAG: ABC transporter substrate-binding protein [Gemmatimonadales bacterium]